MITLASPNPDGHSGKFIPPPCCHMREEKGIIRLRLFVNHAEVQKTYDLQELLCVTHRNGCNRTIASQEI